MLLASESSCYCTGSRIMTDTELEKLLKGTEGAREARGMRQ
jgi:hypothetical protein